MEFSGRAECSALTPLLSHGMWENAHWLSRIGFCARLGTVLLMQSKQVTRPHELKNPIATVTLRWQSGWKQANRARLLAARTDTFSPDWLRRWNGVVDVQYNARQQQCQGWHEIIFAVARQLIVRISASDRFYCEDNHLKSMLLARANPGRNHACLFGLLNPKRDLKQLAIVATIVVDCWVCQLPWGSQYRSWLGEII